MLLWVFFINLHNKRFFRFLLIQSTKLIYPSIIACVRSSFLCFFLESCDDVKVWSFLNPYKTNELFHQFRYNEPGMTHYIY